MMTSRSGARNRRPGFPIGWRSAITAGEAAPPARRNCRHSFLSGFALGWAGHGAEQQKETGMGWSRLWATGLMLGAVAALGGCLKVERLAVPEAQMADARWAVARVEPAVRVDHGPWSAWLDDHLVVDAEGRTRLAYGEVTLTARQALKTYIRSLERVDVTALTRAQQLAYWLNLYNAVVVRTVLDAYPVDSVKAIDFQGLFTFGPWAEPLVRVDGEPLSLNDIVHGILRPVFRDPRLLYGLACGALGCPDLNPVAYGAEDVDAQLDRAARAFVNSDRGLAVLDPGAGDAKSEIAVSRLYGWFRADFGGDEAGIVRHLRRFAEGARAQALAGDVAIDDYAFDWALNDATRPEARRKVDRIEAPAS
ncbi:hypothetical protein CCR80_04585 [Rhodothalassium salexigens]|nr:hypothetical protein [Rhodothalassium salexigens]